jgi:uncharacterized protein YciI
MNTIPPNATARRRFLQHSLAVLPAAAGATAAAPAGVGTSPAHEPAALALADKLLAAVGGRAAWARVQSLVNDSQQNRAEEPTQVRSVITLDVRRPRFRIETWADGLHLVRVVDGERHWRLTRAGAIEPVPERVLEEDRRWYAGHVYRTLHRVAAADPALQLRLGTAGRLEVWEASAQGPQRRAWYALDAKGEPHAFGSHDDNTGSLCGPWEAEFQGLRHPLWVANDGGRWRSLLKSLRVNVALSDEPFSQPASAAALSAPAAEQLFVVEIKTGPAWDSTKPPQEQARFREHSAHLRLLREQGHLVMGARFADKGHLVLRAASPAAARALMDEDPSMRERTFTYELHEFRVFYGGSVAVPARRS